MATRGGLKNRKVYLRLAQELADHLADVWGRRGAQVEDLLDSCGVINVFSPGPVWRLDFVLYPHHRTVRVKLYAQLGTRVFRPWEGQAVLRPKPTASDLLIRVGLTGAQLQWLADSLLEATGVTATLDSNIHRELRNERS